MYAIKKAGTGTGKTEVHILNGANNFQSFLLQQATTLHQTGTDNAWDFSLGDYNGGGKQDVYAIKKVNTGTSKTEVHILNGVNNFQSFLLQTKTALHETGTDYAWDFKVGNYNSDEKLDLYVIKKANTGSDTTEVHELGGNFQLPPPVTPPSPPSDPCGVPFFWQADPAWKNHPLRTNGQCSPSCSTIGACDCTLTSATMVFKYYGANLIPPTLSDCMGTQACPFYWYTGMSCAQGKATGFSKYAFSWTRLDQEVNQNHRPVILGMGKWVSGYRRTHWVVVVSGSGSNPANYTINDPGFKGGYGAKLDSRSATGWTFTDIAVYSGQPSCNLTSSTIPQNDARWLSSQPSVSFDTVTDSQFDKAMSFVQQESIITGTALVYRMTSFTMTLELEAQSSVGSVSEMLIWSDVITNTTWQPFSTYVAMPVSDWVYVQFQDQVGNVSEVVSDSSDPLASPPSQWTRVFLPTVIKQLVYIAVHAQQYVQPTALRVR